MLAAACFAETPIVSMYVWAESRANGSTILRYTMRLPANPVIRGIRGIPAVLLQPYALKATQGTETECGPKSVRTETRPLTNNATGLLIDRSRHPHDAPAACSMRCQGTQQPRCGSKSVRTEHDTKDDCRLFRSVGAPAACLKRHPATQNRVYDGNPCERKHTTIQKTTAGYIPVGRTVPPCC